MAMQPNPPGVMEKNNRIAMEVDKHNRSWNGKEYTYNKHSYLNKERSNNAAYMRKSGNEDILSFRKSIGRNAKHNALKERLKSVKGYGEK